MIDCNEWKRENCHEFTSMGKVKDSNYDGNCMSRHCLSGTYEISGRLIFVEQSVQDVYLHTRVAQESYIFTLMMRLMLLIMWAHDIT